MTGSVDLIKVNFLSNLLPFDIEKKKNGDLRNGLREYKLLLTALSDAIDVFTRKDFIKLDSVVGENACEIRALKSAILATKKIIDFNKLNTQIPGIQQKIDSILDIKSIDALMKENVSLRGILDNQQLDISLTSDEMFVLESFLLTEAKVENNRNQLSHSLLRKDVAAPKKLKKFGEVSSSFTEALVGKLRKLLSTASVNFVRELAVSLGDKNLIRMTSEEFTIKHNTCWPCTPMFWTYKVILLTAQREKIPFLVHAKFLNQNSSELKFMDEQSLLFRNDQNIDEYQYLEMSPTESDLDKIACVVEGVVHSKEDNINSFPTSWKTVFKSFSLFKIILSGAADHRQYPDMSKDQMITDLGDQEFEEHKNFAKEHGFSLENPTTFFIQHVYASSVGSFFANLKNLSRAETRELA